MFRKLLNDSMSVRKKKKNPKQTKKTATYGVQEKNIKYQLVTLHVERRFREHEY